MKQHCDLTLQQVLTFQRLLQQFATIARIKWISSLWLQTQSSILNTWFTLKALVAASVLEIVSLFGFPVSWAFWRPCRGLFGMFWGFNMVLTEIYIRKCFLLMVWTANAVVCILNVRHELYFCKHAFASMWGLCAWMLT